jgi:O-antigen ligase
MTTPAARVGTRRGPIRPSPRALKGTFAALLLFTLIAGDFWRNLISWWGWFALVVLLAIGSITWLVRSRPELRRRDIPKTLAAFLLLATVSIAWSFYPGASAVGVVSQWVTTGAAAFVALCLDREQLLRALGTALRWVIGLSLLFELVVAVIIRHQILPPWGPPLGSYPSGKLPEAFYWSRDLLLHGGQIQGIQGNSNLLAMAALLAAIVFGVQLADRRVGRVSGIVWLALAAAAFVLSRSSTIIIATVVTVVVLAFALWARRAGQARRVPVYVTAAVVLVGGVLSVWALWNTILKVFGKSEDLTGRLTIWQEVTHLAVQRPVFGWGWVSYWAPWVEPFKDLAERKGVTYLQAHNAWLDVWLQLGVVGVVIFAMLVLSTFRRTWFLAVDRRRSGLVDDAPYRAIDLMPLLVLSALIAQSFAESRMLIEGGWALLVIFALVSKRRDPQGELPDVRESRS